MVTYGFTICDHNALKLINNISEMRPLCSQIGDNWLTYCFAICDHNALKLINNISEMRPLCSQMLATIYK